MSKNDMLGPIVRALVGVPQERQGVILDAVNKIGGEEGELWKVRLATVLREGVKPEVVAPPEPLVFLRQLFPDETIVLGPTGGKRTIAQAREVFPGGIDGDFENWDLDVPDEPTQATKISIHEMISDGRFGNIYGSLNHSLDQLRYTQDQIIEFCVNHKDKLRQDGYGTFFLFKVRNEFFVANVFVGSGGRLRVGVHRFSGGYVWGARCHRRFVLPQLEPLTTSA